MDHVLLVCVLQRIDNLVENRQDLLNRHDPVRHAFSERRTFHQLHHQGALFHAVDRGDIRMVQRRQHLRLAREARHAVGILGEHIGQNLDGDVAIEFRVSGAPDLAHAAFAQLSGDPVMRDGGWRAHEFRAFWHRNTSGSSGGVRAVEPYGAAATRNPGPLPVKPAFRKVAPTRAGSGLVGS